MKSVSQTLKLFLTCCFLCIVPVWAQESKQVTLKDRPGGFSGGIAVLGVPIGQSKLAELITKIKNLHPGNDTPDDMVRLLGPTDHVTKQGNQEEWVYQYIIPPDDREYSLAGMRAFDTGVKCFISLGSDGKILSIKVQKIHDGHEEILYVKGDNEASSVADSGSPGIMPNLQEAPAAPKTGQIYINTTDKHFYGWDGTSWLKLDTKP